MDDLIYAVEPTVALFADGAAMLDRMAEWSTAAGARVVMRGPIANAAEAMNDCLADAVLVEAVEDGGAALDRLLDRLDADAAADRRTSVVAVAPALIDIAAARLTQDGVTLLSGGSEAERVAALALALAPRPSLMFEERGDDSLQLRRMREEVSRIARALASVAGGEERPLAPPPAPPAGKPAIEDEPGAALLRQLIRARRLRDQFFKPSLFADPAWDMLLDLMLARMEGRTVAVSSLCIAAAVPPTTALRWIKWLVDDGLFVRTADPLDGRRVFIDLSEAGTLAMMRYLRASLAGGREG